jgi:3-hydroxyacyl-[acyl-carrier-protein] dehydratase
MSAIVMEIEEILKYLPHRSPFLLIDRVIEFTSCKSLTAIKNVSYNEPFFAGHFPGAPIMPGVLILESLAQAAAVFAIKSTEDQPKMANELYLFAGIDQARFKRVVKPGDQLRLEISMLRSKKSFLKVHAVATVGGETACSAELMSAKIGTKS